MTVLELIPGRRVPLSPRRPTDGEGTARESTIVTRLLPQRQRPTVGAFCFVDTYGPDDITSTDGMRVAPHPHMGLQTVSWLTEGHVLHRDSVGSEQLIRPGELGLMTAGRGISHSEESPPDPPPLLHGIQLWVALPSGARDFSPAWEHHADLPSVTLGTARAVVVMGSFRDVTSPATVHSPLVAADLVVGPEGATLPLDRTYEHGLVVIDGEARLEDGGVGIGELGYLPPGRSELRLQPGVAVHLLLIGGEPFGEDLLMWWNFVGRSQEEVEVARKEWKAGGERFGEVTGYPYGPRIPAPPMPGVPLKPRRPRAVPSYP